MKKTEYDFRYWTSFPSSFKIVNDETTHLGVTVDQIAARPGAKIVFVIKAKLQNILYGTSHIALDGWDGTRWFRIEPPPYVLIDSGSETVDWRRAILETVVPSGVSLIRPYLVGGGGTPEAPGITWFDDLEILQDGELIYGNDFSNWSPIIGAGVGAPIGGVAGYLLKEPLGPMVSEVVGAVVGGALGGGIGLLTGMGIVPIPQIPALGAAPEGPGAPARLGKYLITG